MFKLLKENNVKTIISAMIWKENVHKLEEMISLTKPNGVSKVNLAFLIPEGRAKTDNTIKLLIGKYREMLDIVARLRKKYKSEDFDIEIYCVCIALSKIYKGSFTEPDSLNEFLEK